MMRAPAPLFHLRRDQPYQATAANSFCSMSPCRISSVIFSNGIAREVSGVVDDDVDLGEGLHHLVIGRWMSPATPTSACTPMTRALALFLMAETASSSDSLPRATMATSAPDCAKRVATRGRCPCCRR